MSFETGLQGEWVRGQPAQHLFRVADGQFRVVRAAGHQGILALNVRPDQPGQRQVLQVDSLVQERQSLGRVVHGPVPAQEQIVVGRDGFDTAQPLAAPPALIRLAAIAVSLGQHGLGRDTARLQPDGFLQPNQTLLDVALVQFNLAAPQLDLSRRGPQSPRLGQRLLGLQEPSSHRGSRRSIQGDPALHGPELPVRLGGAVGKVSDQQRRHCHARRRPSQGRMAPHPFPQPRQRSGPRAWMAKRCTWRRRSSASCRADW